VICCACSPNFDGWPWALVGELTPYWAEIINVQRNSYIDYLADITAIYKFLLTEPFVCEHKLLISS
jgi:hypothetical protein